MELNTPPHLIMMENKKNLEKIGENEEEKNSKISVLENLPLNVGNPNFHKIEEVKGGNDGMEGSESGKKGDMGSAKKEEIMERRSMANLLNSWSLYTVTDQLCWMAPQSLEFSWQTTLENSLLNLGKTLRLGITADRHKNSTLDMARSWSSTYQRHKKQVESAV